MNKSTNPLKLFCALLAGLMMSVSAFAQTKPVTITVFDETGPLPGASIMVKGTTTGTMTDLDGNAVLDLKQGDVLEVSFIGYHTTEATVGSGDKLQVVLKEDTTLLDETIVVGYGVQKKETLTGAVSQIRTDDITNTKSPDALLSLQGKVPGLLIRDMGGKPGSFSTQLSLRGYGGSPMIVVDGVVRSQTMTRKSSGYAMSAKQVEEYTDISVLQEINPEDIESVSVLKDASAAIYGLGASNGVILITTKKGQSQTPSVSLTTSVRLTQPVTNHNVEDWVSFMRWDNAMADVGRIPHRFTEEEIAGYAAGDPAYQYTNWYDEVMKTFAVNQMHNASIRGGTDKVNYYFGVGYMDDSSIMKSEAYAYNRWNINGSVTANLTDNLKMTYTTSMRISNQNTPGNPDADWNMQYHIYATDPRIGVHPIKSVNPETGEIEYDLTHWSAGNENMNVVAMLDPESTGISKNISRTFNNTVDLQYTAPWLPGLTLQLSGAYDYSTGKFRSLVLQYDTYDYKTNTYAATSRAENEYSELYTDNQRLYGRFQANYNKRFGKHNIGATLAAEVTKNDRARIQGSRKYGNTTADSFYTHDILDQGLATTADNSGVRNSSASAGYIGRVTYDYAGKYLAEVMARVDGSYMYAPGYRWGVFPAYSLGWRISEENFFKQALPFINNLKFRWSDGFTGMTQGSAYAYIAGYTSSGSYIFSDGITTPAWNSTTVENTLLSWAKVRMMDFGIDWEMWHGKFGGTFDWFKRVVDGIAATRSVSLPDFYGVSLPQENLNVQENEGLELSLYTSGSVGQFNYRVTGSATYTRTRMTYIESENGKGYNSSMNYWKTSTLNRWSNARSASRYEWAGGQFTSLDYISNLGVLYDTNMTGSGNRDMVPGMYALVDRNGDGYITGDDMFYTWSDDNPPLQFGLTFSGNYKNLDFSLVFSGASLKSKSLGLSSYSGFGYLYQLPKMFTEDCWSVKNYGDDPWDPNTEWNSGYWPALARVRQVGNAHNVTYTSNQPYNFIDATYLRLKTIEVGYRFSPEFIRKIGIKSLRVYFNGGNLFTLCNKNLRFVDPESNDYGRAGGSFQINRSFSFGLNLNF